MAKVELRADRKTGGRSSTESKRPGCTPYISSKYVSGRECFHALWSSLTDGAFRGLFTERQGRGFLRGSYPGSCIPPPLRGRSYWQGLSALAYPTSEGRL